VTNERRSHEISPPGVFHRHVSCWHLTDMPTAHEGTAPAYSTRNLWKDGSLACLAWQGIMLKIYWRN
jgi:hypothetical protein